MILIGVPCTGVWEDGHLAAKCYACAEEVSPFADVTVDPVGSEGRAVADDPRDAEIAALEGTAHDRALGVLAAPVWPLHPLLRLPGSLPALLLRDLRGRQDPSAMDPGFDRRRR